MYLPHCQKSVSKNEMIHRSALVTYIEQNVPSFIIRNVTRPPSKFLSGLSNISNNFEVNAEIFVIEKILCCRPIQIPRIFPRFTCIRKFCHVSENTPRFLDYPLCYFCRGKRKKITFICYHLCIPVLTQDKKKKCNFRIP